MLRTRCFHGQGHAARQKKKKNQTSTFIENRSQIKKYIKEEKILVNNKAVKAGYKLVLGDIISVKYEDKIVLKPLKMDLDILYEDEDIAVISKPQNLAVHPGTGHMEDTLVNALLYNFKTLAKGSGELRPEQHTEIGRASCRERVSSPV